MLLVTKAWKRGLSPFNPPASSVQVPADARICSHQNLLLLANELSLSEYCKVKWKKQAVVADECWATKLHHNHSGISGTILNARVPM